MIAKSAMAPITLVMKPMVPYLDIPEITGSIKEK